MRKLFGFLIVFVVAAVAVAACDPADRDSDSPATFDESSSNNVWHQARLRGVSFRAIGQEPGWLLEITTGSEILLVLDYGQSRTVYAYVEPEVYPELHKSRYRTGDLEILLEGKDCQDTMSGEEFAATVTVTIDNRRLSGCGRALR